MIIDIFDQITGAQRPSLLSQQEFRTVDELFSAYEHATGPVLLIVEPDALTEVLSWLDLDDDVCLTTDPDSLVSHRLQALALPDKTQFDPVTGLLNRDAFNEAVAAALEDESLDTLSLMICQLDQLKQLNEQQGREQADEILATIGDLLQTEATECDLVCRFSGKEFGILSDRDEASARQLAQRIQQLVNWQLIDGSKVSLSIGIATEARQYAADLIAKADEALRAAEATGWHGSIHHQQLQASLVLDLQANAKGHQSEIPCDTNDMDALTQLYNREYLDRRLAREVKNPEVPLCIAFADIDRFRDINQQFGRPTGDEVLREVGEIIRNQLRDCDWVGRYGGEEFCIVMQNTPLSKSLPILERLRQAVESHEFVSASNDRFTVTISIGAVESTSEEGPEQLLERAGQRAHAAKHEGWNRVLT